jgi:phosphoribosylamine--glycine ligase
MKFLVLDIEGDGTGVDIAWRAKLAGHDVRYWLPPTRAGNLRPYGDGMFSKPKEWKGSMDWAELIFITGNNKYADELGEYFGHGYPIFGCNPRAALLELDRGKGQEILAQYGIKTQPYTVVSSVDEAIAHVVKTGKGYALKPWGGDSNSAMTHVARDANEAVFTLKRWERLGLFKGQLMLQELIEGIEIGISGFFGPGGWLKAKEESFEHKKFLTGDLGENTGEMGTVIRHVGHSKLFDEILEPLTEYLHAVNYIGDCSVNCIVEKEGNARPLEFTMRPGWPDFCIRQEVFKGDPITWMGDLLYGKDSLRTSSQIAVGVVMVHGDFPKCKDPPGTWAGFPIEGLDNSPAVHFQQVQMDETHRVVGKKVVKEEMFLTAGVYPMVLTGSAGTVSVAKDRAMVEVEKISWPSNLMYRIDVGDRLEEELKELQKHGYATDMRFK